MSFDVYLRYGDELAVVPPHQEGGTYVLGGTDEADLNITYNYSKHYYEHLNSDAGLRWLDGKVAGETLKALETAVTKLGTERDSDYWAATPGNAGHALSILLEWAKVHPTAVWEVS